MEITFELIFSVVTVIVTALLGTFLKNSVVPKKFIPIQNLVIGIIAALVAVYFGLFDNIPAAILISLALSMGVGGTYDLVKTNTKAPEVTKL